MGDSFSFLNNSLVQRGKDGLGIHMLFGRDGQSRKRKKQTKLFI